MAGGELGATWIIVCGGFHARGGMDRLNASLARYLADAGIPVHLVAHDVDRDLVGGPDVAVSIVPRTLGAHAAGEIALERRAREVARALRSSRRNVRLVANGANCAGADVNWVHCVHRAWPCVDTGAPAWFRVKNRAVKAWARHRERRAIGTARTVIANSERTRRDLVTMLRCDPATVHTVYPGLDAATRIPDADERARARSRWCADPERPLVVFVGALSCDANKGLDTVLNAWQSLSRCRWDAELVAAGGGAIEYWTARARRAGVDVRFTGHSRSIPDLLSAADLLVSPARYEAYGLAVHEALARGVPAMVSAAAGIAERWPDTARELVLADPTDSDELARRLAAWRRNINGWHARFAEAADVFHRYTARDMAARIVQVATAADPTPVPAACR